MTDIGTIKTDWSEHLYYKSGKALGDLLTVAIGPVKKDTRGDFNSAIEFIGGLLEEFSIDNDLDSLAKCADNPENVLKLTAEIVTALNESANVDGSINIVMLVELLPVTLTACDDIYNDVTEISDWVNQFSGSRSQLIGDMVRRILLKPIQVSNDVKGIENNWNAKQYAASGAATADLVTLTMGKVGTEMNLPEFKFVSIPEVLAGFVEGMVGESNLTEIEACYQSEG